MATPSAATPVDPVLDVDQMSLGSISVQGDDEPSEDQAQAFLSALVQSEHLNLLVGAGLTSAVAHAASAGSAAGMSGVITTSDGALDASLEAAAKDSARRALRGDGNIEDRLRVALTVLPGLRLLGDSRADLLDSATAEALETLARQVADTEKGILAGATLVRARSLLTGFLRAFAVRVPTRDRLHVFTTNYDRVVEWGAEDSGLRIIDRFVGTLRPVFRSSRLEIDYHYSPPGSVKEPHHLDGVIRFTKLHGSLDWNSDATDVVRTPTPFGSIPDKSADLLIYPVASKDRETAEYPYSDLFRDLSAALCRPNAALVTYGYGFGDDHINRAIRDMLTLPSTHLVIIAYGDPTGRIARFHSEHRHTGQVSLLFGPRYADLPALVERWLPWPAAEPLARAQVEIMRASDASSRVAPGAPMTSGSVS